PRGLLHRTNGQAGRSAAAAQQQIGGRLMSAPSQLSPLQVMQLHDGELDEQLEAEVLAELALAGGDTAEQLEGLEQLGDFLRESGHQGASTPYVSIADQVMAA